MTASQRDERRSVPEPLRAAIEALETDARIDRLGPPMERVAAPVSQGAAASILRGEWMGHALHPLLTDVPLGCWMSAGVLDLIGGRRSRKAAQRLIGVGLLAVPPTVAAGLSEWTLLRDERRRRVGIVHAVGNGVVAVLYLQSWRARRRGHHLRGVVLAMAGGLGGWLTGYLGGHLSFARQAGTGERGLDIDLSFDGRDARDDEIVGEHDASRILGVPVEQLHAMVDEHMVEPVTRSPELHFRRSDLEALRLLGA